MITLRTLGAALWLLTLAGGASAQIGLIAPQPAAEAPAAAAPTAAPATAPAAGSPAPAAAPNPAAAALAPLLDALRDDARRAALIAELERLAAAPAAAPAAPIPAEPAPAEDLNFGQQLARLGGELIDRLENAGEGFLNGLAATQRRLAGLYGERSGALLAAATELAAVFAATAGAFFALRLLARGMFRRIEAGMAGASPLRRAGGWLTMVGLEVLTVALAWSAGVAVVVTNLARDATPESQANNALYLTAFMATQMSKVAIRAVLSPYVPALRAVPLSDAAARYWSGRLGVLASLIGYGLLLAVPLVNQSVSIFTGRAVAVVVYALVLVWSMALVIRHRRAPAAWLAERAGADATLRVLAVIARFWHWPVLLFLVTLFFTAVSQSGDVGPVLTHMAKAIAALAAGAAVGTLMSRGARRGVRLPEDVKHQMPLLEERVNGFMLRFLGAARFMLLIGTLGGALDVGGVFDASGWFTRRFGEDFVGLLGAVMTIVLVSFALWLAMASWVDYRLNPDRKDQADARERTLLTLGRNAGTIAIVIFTGMFTLSEIGLDIGPLLASAGVLGLAISFGAQKLVQDIITGTFIQFENAINVGDVVTVAGVTGTVEKLTIRSVSLRTLDGTFHIIPFSSVDMVSNFMRGFAFHVADIGVAYREDLGAVKALMHEAFDDVKAMPAHRPNILGALDWHGVIMLGDNAVTLRARVRTRPGAQWAVGRAYTEAVKRRFDAAGVEIPFPQTTIWLGQGKEDMASALSTVMKADAAPEGAKPAGA